MIFTVIIDENRAKEILISASFCYEEDMGGNLSFLLKKIKEQFPDLWLGYQYLDKAY